MSEDFEIESCREVYLQTCAGICESFSVDGFRYAKSGPRMSKKCGDFTFVVSFQACRYNSRGENVRLWIHANVYSPTVKRWRSNNQSLRGESDFVAGGQIGNLRKQFSWMEWEVAKPELRGERIQNAIGAIRNIALPYFAAFEDVPRLCERLEREEVPSVSIEDRIDFLACYATAQAVRNALKQFVAEHSHEQLGLEIARAMPLIRRNEPLGPDFSWYCVVVTKAMVIYNLDENFILARS